jgi:N-acetylmuramoyl-L-alanine amidase
VRKSFSFLIVLFACGVGVLVARPFVPVNARAEAFHHQETQQETSPAQQTTPGQASSQIPASYTGLVVVLDPAHGGTDMGARGESGAVEKDVVLEFARAVRGELEREGYHVVMTRNDDSNPSYDERAATANAYRDAVFISLHASSTGTIGTVRTYFYQFWSSFPPSSASVTTPGAKPAQQAEAPATGLTAGLTVWEEAQRSHAEASRHLADALQGELAQRFGGSPVNPGGAAIRGLRSIDAPAVAVEVSSVSVSDLNSLTAMAAPLATSIAHGIVASRPASSMGTR